MTKTKRFLRELHTAEKIVSVAKEHGTTLTLEQAHEAWIEYSDDYSAGWLILDPERPEAEILEALTKYRERHAAAMGGSS